MTFVHNSSVYKVALTSDTIEIVISSTVVSTTEMREFVKANVFPSVAVKINQLINEYVQMESVQLGQKIEQLKKDISSLEIALLVVKEIEKSLDNRQS